MEEADKDKEATVENCCLSRFPSGIHIKPRYQEAPARSEFSVQILSILKILYLSNH